MNAKQSRPWDRYKQKIVKGFVFSAIGISEVGVDGGVACKGAKRFRAGKMGIKSVGALVAVCSSSLGGALFVSFGAVDLEMGSLEGLG